VLRGAVGAGSVLRLRAAVDDVVARPGRLRATNGEALPDSYLWLRDDDCLQALLETRLAALAAAVLGSRRVRLYYDPAFVKPAGRSVATPWHQDGPYWPLSGAQMCSVWLALDEVRPETGALCYLAGSHRWGREFRPPSALDPTAWEGLYDDAPDFDHEQFAALRRAVPMEPGDCVVHHARVVHSSYPNVDPSTSRRAYVTRWLGDDVRFLPRPQTTSFPVPVALREGDELDHPLFPVLWEEARSP